MGLFKGSKFHKGKVKSKEIKEDDFNLYFFEVTKHKKTDDQVIARFCQLMKLGKSDVKEEIVRCLTEIEGGVTTAIHILTEYCAASKAEAMRLCYEMMNDLHPKYNNTGKQCVIDKVYTYVIEVYYYVKPEYIPKDEQWSIVKDLPDNLIRS